MAQRVTIAHQGTTIAQLQAAADLAAADIAWAEITNKDNLATFDKDRRRSAAELAAVTADRDRLAKLMKTIKIDKERLNVEAQKCVGVPPAGRALASWVRDNPDPAGGH